MKNKPQVGQIGTSYEFFFTMLGEVISNDSIAMADKINMLKDETIKSGLSFLSNYVRSYIGKFSHPDEKITDFVTNNLENLEQSFQIYTDYLFQDAIAFGFTVGELVWDLSSGNAALNKIVVFPPQTVAFLYKQKQFIGVRQYTTYDQQDVNKEKLVVIKHGRGVYGESVLDSLYKFWKFKQMVFKLWPVAMEKYALPPIVGRTSDPVGNADKFSKLWSQGVLSLNHDDDARLLSATSNMVPDFKNTIDALNTWIYRGLMIPQLLSSMGSIGSLAAAKTHLDMFETNAKSLAQWFSENLIDTIVYPMIKYNFGEQETYGEFEFTDTLDSDERLKLMNTFVAGVNSGILDPVSDDGWIRSLLRFPQEKLK